MGRVSGGPQDNFDNILMGHIHNGDFEVINQTFIVLPGYGG
jgi:predicted phosphodiesterase